MNSKRTDIAIDVLKVHPRNTEFFDDISGNDYENLKQSIADDGILYEIIVAPDMTIISGHQRYRAAKELGFTTVPVRIHDGLLDEDEKLKILLVANFGRSKNDFKKQRKVADEYTRLRGYGGQGRPKKDANLAHLSLDKIAQELGTSKRNLQRMLRIERDLTEEMKQFLDDGVITKTVAADIIASLSDEEQNELVSKLDVTKKYTENKILEELSSIKEQIEKKKKKSSTKKTDDTEATKKIKQLKDKVENLKIKNDFLKEQNDALRSSKEASERMLERYKAESEEYTEVKRKIIDMGLDQDGEYNLYGAASEVAKLHEKLQQFLQDELSPVKFQPFMFSLKGNTIIRKNFLNTLGLVYEWYRDMMTFIGEDIEKYTEDEIIDVEEN